MPVRINLQLLERKPQQLEGEIPFAELAPDFADELIRLPGALTYRLTAELQRPAVLLTGELTTEVECDCARCLRTFLLPVAVQEFSALVPLDGEDSVPVDGDFADLTPILREDILLALPTNPLCREDCRGLPDKTDARDNHFSATSPDRGNPAWEALDKLKL
jgi:uncharacterized protein